VALLSGLALCVCIAAMCLYACLPTPVACRSLVPRALRCCLVLPVHACPYARTCRTYHVQALEEYNKAIEKEPTDGTLYSNRSATHAELGNWRECLDDATACLKLRPDWFKVPPLPRCLSLPCLAQPRSAA